jgi:hypothetical protein
LMKLFRRVSKEEPALNDRRKNRVERLRRQREIEEEFRKRMRTFRPDLGPPSFW